MGSDIAPLISDYGLIGNCRTAALVSKTGSIDWCCFPQFDSPSTFARLLDEKGGHYTICPREAYESHQSYLGDTNVLQTHFRTPGGGHATLTDFFAVKKQDADIDQLWPDEEIVRILDVTSGEIEFTHEFCPRSDYGLNGIRFTRIGNWGLKMADGKKHLLLQSTLPQTTTHATFTARAGDTVIFSLSYSDEAPAVMPPLTLAHHRLRRTLEYWNEWSARTRTEDSPYAHWIRRSALALKLLNFAPSGAFVAAPTTSLPEWIGGTRNWDYRFCWLRDAAFTTRTLLNLGHLEEAKSFLNWMLHSTRLTRPRLQVLYTLYGESRIHERDLKWLSGFGGSRPVRIGNCASEQIQLDIYGEVIDSFYTLSPHLGDIDSDTKKMILGFAEWVAEHWAEPDHGIWEVRDELAHYTHSKLMCWVAMDRLSKISQKLGWNLPYNPAGIADEIRDEIVKHAYSSERGAYTRAFGGHALDSALLVMPLVGFCDANDPHFVSTRAQIIKELSNNNLIYRYPPASDNIAGGEGAFVLCNFWLAESFAMGGEIEEAKRWFESAARVLSPTGLAAEEIDPRSFVPLGNYPQGFSHIGLIRAARAIHMATKNRRLTA